MNVSFLSILNASISASWLVLVVIALRFALKKAPKAIHCALWALVAIRLLCPITIESEFSLMPSGQTVSDDYLTQESASDSGAAVLEIVDNPVYPQDVEVPLVLPAHRMERSIFRWNVIWPVGVAAMAVYALISYLRLRKKIAASIPIADGVLLCDYIGSPFILGVCRPKIYLPSELEQETIDHVLAHERAHLARHDHWWKPLGFALLSLHWFNPVMWVAYILLCRDIELACDEKVIKDLDAAKKKSYSAALLQCAVGRGMIAACPLAFGEVGVKERVKTVLNYKKPAFWVIVLAVILCGVVAVCFLTDPPAPDIYDIVYQDSYTVLDQREERFDISVPVDVLPDDIYSQEGHTFDEKEVVVYETDTSAIWLVYARYANEGSDKMYFQFDISYDLPKSGSILMISRYIPGTHTSTTCFHPTDRTLYDGETIFADAVSLRGQGPAQKFTVYLDTEAVRAAQKELRFGVSMNLLTYVKAGHEAEELPTEEILPEGTYVSQEKLFWAWYSSLYVEGMTMEVGKDSVTLDLKPSSLAGLTTTHPLERWWQQACPIDEGRRQLLAELSNLEPMFALRDLSSCRYLVLDASHFIVEENGELYLVCWQMSSINLEIIQYIFHMVPEAEYQKASVTIPLGQATLEPDPTEETIREHILQYNMPYMEADQMAVVSSDITANGDVLHNDEPILYQTKLNVRIAQYSKASDGTIRELSFQYFTVEVRYSIKDGVMEISDYSQAEAAEIPDNALQLEADCWNQAHACFQPDTDAMIEDLRQRYPEYLEISTAEGIELYWWDTAEGIRCIILPGTNWVMTAADLAAMPALTVPEAMMILGSYQLPRSSQTFYRIQDDVTAVAVP